MSSPSSLSVAMMPAIPDGDIPLEGVRTFFTAAPLPDDPFAERIVGHFRRVKNFSLGGQIALWPQESQKTD